MAEKDRTYRIFISVAEPSADAHCASLIKALQKSTYNIDFVGVGGPKMAEAGCQLLQTTIGQAVMMYKAFAYLGHYYKLIKRITRYLTSNNVDLVIVCDSPSFNFHIAKAAKKAGTKTLFYIAPQLWAWAGWRIRKLQKYCDKLACILPFEQQLFRSKGVDALFVGNPLLEKIDSDLASCRKQYSDFDPKSAAIALMPGSRTAEINALWRPIQQIAMRLRRKYPNAAFTTVAVDNHRERILRSTQILGFRSKYAVGSVNEVARSADFAIVASGSATLQVAAAGCPMVVMYQSSRILWHLLGRWLIKTEYLSLVNILAERELVPEFMPYFVSIEPIVETIGQLFSDQLTQLAEPLASSGASEKVAQIVTGMLD
jgi:lipid-A-disaccharide synthase